MAQPVVTVVKSPAHPQLLHLLHPHQLSQEQRTISLLWALRRSPGWLSLVSYDWMLDIAGTFLYARSLLKSMESDCLQGGGAIPVRTDYKRVVLTER